MMSLGVAGLTCSSVYIGMMCLGVAGLTRSSVGQYSSRSLHRVSYCSDFFHVYGFAN